MHSCLYAGRVAHVRREPVIHRFVRPVAFAYLDLDEAGELVRRSPLLSSARFAPLSFCPADHAMSAGAVGSPSELADSVRDEVARSGGHRPAGPVRLLTQFRQWGVYFSPINLYYCFATDGRTVEAIVAEVSNTPWNERRLYVLDEQRRIKSAASGASPCGGDDASTLRYRHAKDFHVSPFMSMAASYAWRISPPGDRLSVAVRCREAGRKPFDAAMALTRRPWSNASLAASIVRFPLTSVQILAAIYWQAFRLWTKRCPYFPHPGRTSTSG